MQKLFYGCRPALKKKTVLKSSTRSRNLTSIKKRVRRISHQSNSAQIWVVRLTSKKFASTSQKHYPDPDSVTWSVWNLCARSSDVISRGNQWSRHEMASIFLDKKWGGYFFFDRGIRRQRLERKRKNSKKVFSNVFLWVFTLTSGSRRRLCFCGVKNVKSNPGPGYSKQG